MEFEKINRNGVSPMYEQVKKTILEKVKQGDYKPGEMIPTERELCEKTGVSRHTVRKAISELVEDGYLFRVQGHGTFVYDEDNIPLDLEHSTVGVILPLSEGEYDREILRGVDEIIKENEFSLTFSSSGDNSESEEKSIKRLLKRGVDGFVIMPAADEQDKNIIKRLKAEGIPFVLVDRKISNCETDCVMSSNTEGGYLATKHLIELGYERIAFVQDVKSEISSIKDRFQGYKQALEEYDIEFEQNLHLILENQEKEIQKNIYQFIKLEKPEAIFAHNDKNALRIYKVCREKGINIPGELSLVGYDNIEAGKHLETPLTTVAQYPYEMGKLAAERLLERIKAQKGEGREYYKQIYYPVELKVKESTCPANEMKKNRKFV
ncbi:MAG: GntR family transcriptional regulator [Bacillota bacterium]